MKTYIVYDSNGHEVGYWRGQGKGVSQNSAEAAAKAQLGDKATVAYTELGKEFDHIKQGFFTDADAR
jgi:hypothetical protein